MKQAGGARRARQEEEVYILRLYVAGNEQNSRIARENLQKLCEEYLNGRHRIEEVDILEDCDTAMREGIFVTPTLVLLSPEPRTRVIGNLSDREKVISALRLRR